MSFEADMQVLPSPTNTPDQPMLGLQDKAQDLNVDSVNEIFAGNQSSVNADNGSNSKIASVYLEQHQHHYSPTSPETGKPSTPNRNHWNKLVRRYKDRDSWIYPFCWDESQRFELNDYYVQLDLEVLSREGKHKEGERASTDGMFDPLVPEGDRVQTVLLLGDSGYGKSVLCQKMAFDWAYGTTTVRGLSPTITLLVLYKLRELKPESNLEKELFDFVHSHYSPSEPSVRATRDILESLGMNVLIILDGYDQISTQLQEQVKEILKSTDCAFRSASFLITSRQCSDQEFCCLFERTFSLQKVSQKNSGEIVKKFFKIDPFRRKHTYYMSSEVYWTYWKMIVISPFFTFLLCWLKKYQKQRYCSKRLAARAFYYLAKNCNDRQGFGLSEEHISNLVHYIGIFCLRKYDVFYLYKDMEQFFSTDIHFVIAVGLFRFCTPGQKTSEALIKPVHKSLVSALACVAWTTLKEKLYGCNEQDEIVQVLEETRGTLDYDISLSMFSVAGIVQDLEVCIYNQYLEGGADPWRFECDLRTGKTTSVSKEKENRANEIVFKIKYTPEMVLHQCVDTLVRAYPCTSALQTFSVLWGCMKCEDLRFCFYFDNLENAKKHFPVGLDSELTIGKHSAFSFKLSRLSDYRQAFLNVVQNWFQISPTPVTTEPRASVYLKEVIQYLKTKGQPCHILVSTKAFETYIDTNQEYEFKSFDWNDITMLQFQRGQNVYNFSLKNSVCERVLERIARRYE